MAKRAFVRTLLPWLFFFFGAASPIAKQGKGRRSHIWKTSAAKTTASTSFNLSILSSAFADYEAKLRLAVSALARPSLLLVLTAALVAKTVSSEPVRRAAYFWKEAGPIVAHYRWTQFILSVTNASRAHRDAIYAKLHQRYARPCLDIALQLKGLYVKIGQVLSARPDFMPVEYTSLLSTLQDSIPQWPIERVRQVVSESLQREHGLDFDEVFCDMDAVALGSASIGQVHRATLVDTYANQYWGSNEVAVKVMHPGSKRRFQYDFAVFRWLCRVALPGWKQLLSELERQLMTEFDYQNEALSLQLVRRNLGKSKLFRSRIVIPDPHMQLSTEHVLVMELLRGRRFEDWVLGELERILGPTGQADALVARRKQELLGIEVKGDTVIASAGLWTKLRLFALQRSIVRYVNLLVDFHGHQIFVDGVWNGDPHPGNCLILDNGQLGLIDYGQTKRMEDNRERLAMAKIIVSLTDDSDEADTADAMLQAGFRIKDNKDSATMTKYAMLFFDSDHESRRLGFPTPQQYFASLMHQNGLVIVPDAAIFIARTSFLFRGMGTAIDQPERTANQWRRYALQGFDDR